MHQWRERDFHFSLEIGKIHHPGFRTWTWIPKKFLAGSRTWSPGKIQVQELSRFEKPGSRPGSWIFQKILIFKNKIFLETF
jgi:hypothetical protein